MIIVWLTGCIATGVLVEGNGIDGIDTGSPSIDTGPKASDTGESSIDTGSPSIDCDTPAGWFYVEDWHGHPKDIQLGTVGRVSQPLVGQGDVCSAHCSRAWASMRLAADADCQLTIPFPATVDVVEMPTLTLCAFYDTTDSFVGDTAFCSLMTSAGEFSMPLEVVD